MVKKKDFHQMIYLAFEKDFTWVILSLQNGLLNSTRFPDFYFLLFLVPLKTEHYCTKLCSAISPLFPPPQKKPQSFMSESKN